MTRNFKREFLVYELELPWCGNYKIIDTTRWSGIYELIFEYEGKYWRTHFSTGLTEMQDESPWEYEDEVECEEVEKRMIQVEAWMPVEDDNNESAE